MLQPAWYLLISGDRIEHEGLRFHLDFEAFSKIKEGGAVINFNLEDFTMYNFEILSSKIHPRTFPKPA